MQKKLWAPLLAAALLLLGSCGKTTAEPTPPSLTAEALAGLWVCPEAELTETLRPELIAGDEALFALFDLPPLCMELELTLVADGSFTLALDGEESRLALDSVIEAAEAGVREYLLEAVRSSLAEGNVAPEKIFETYGCADETAFAELSLGMTLEEVFARMGFAAAIESRWKTTLSNGRWTIEGGVLTLNETPAAYDASADTLTFENRVYRRK